MDWHPSPFEPNLKFVIQLKDDLKTKYFEQHEKAKKTMEEFSCFLQNIFLKHQQLLSENIELSVTNERLKKIVDGQECNQQVAAIIEPPSSEILGASPNCKLKNLSKFSVINKKNNLDNQSSSIVQKENINDFPPIYSEDFTSDVEDDSFLRYKSPPASVVNSPAKVLSSPILSKRKKNSSKKSNASTNTSSQSIDSNNDSKVSSFNTSTFDKNIDIDHDLSKEFGKEYENEPLKPIENILQSPSRNNQDKNVVHKILNVSKTNYAKTEILDKGKKSRQTMLNFKKVAPVLDISKVDFDKSFGNMSKNILKQGNSWNETFCHNNSTRQNSDSILTNMKKFNSPRNGLKEAETSSNQNNFGKEVECVEISPIQNGKSSKLRNKFRFNNKPDISNVKEKNSKLSDEKLSFPSSNNNTLQQKRSFKSTIPEKKYEKKVNLAAHEPIRTISDETYFSPAELANHKTDITNIEVDFSEFEDDNMQCETPPAKKILLNSFDIIPGRAEKTPDYAYKEGPVRKKSEKEKLPGWSCRDCEKYYGHLPENERKLRQNQCSRHRGKYKPQADETPDSFWYPLINDTHDESMFND